MKRILSSIGVGSATVDTVLDSTELEPGETVDLEVQIEGGNTEQEIDGLYFYLETKYKHPDGGYETETIEKSGSRDSFTIEPDEHRVLPASMTLPRVTPLTKGKVDVWLKTGLDIDWAKDPQDRDRIEVVPDPEMAAVLEAIEQLGFVFSESDCKEASVYSPAPFVQEFEYEPTNSEFRRKIDELEVVFAPHDDELEVRLEIDRRDDTYVDLTGSDERQLWVTVEHTDRNRLRDDFRAIIDQQF